MWNIGDVIYLIMVAPGCVVTRYPYCFFEPESPVNSVVPEPGLFYWLDK